MSSLPASATWLHQVEDAFLRHDVTFFHSQLNTPTTSTPAESAPLLQSFLDILEGRIEEAICSPVTLKSLLAPLLQLKSKDELLAFDLSASLSTAIHTFLSTASNSTLAQAHILVLAIACLNDFVSQNYTGPPTAEMVLFQQAEWSSELQAEAREWASSKLRLDGEDVYEFSYHPIALLIAKTIFLQKDIDSLLSECKSLPWWSLRYGRVHQDLLEQNSATLKGHVDATIPKAIATYGIPTASPIVTDTTASSESTATATSFEDFLTAPTPSTSTASSTASSSTFPDPLLATHLYLEAAHILHGYWQYKGIDECLSNAQRALGVEVELTGVMGKRTKWQKEEKAQLIVKVTQSEHRRKEMTARLENATQQVDPILLENLPHNLTLDSDVLLESVELNPETKDPQPPCPLGPEEQALLLAMHENRKKTTSSHITRDEEMMGYVVRVLQESKSGRPGGEVNRSWALECSALFHRSVLECGDHHAQERALQQLEELSAIFDRLHAPTTVASVAALNNAKALTDFKREDVVRVRMHDVWISNYPSIWTLKLGIAATFQKIGLFKSALDLFISIQAYDGVIESCMLLGKITQAEALIRDRLVEKPEDPKLLCLLADCTRDITYYEQAWKNSGETYPRAQRSLGNYKMKHGPEYEAAIKHFQLALDLNPVFPAEWYAMGWCAMQIKNYEVAAVAFSRTVSFDPDYANAWNNLAASHLYMKNKPAGFSALEQAIKFKADSWKLWENYLVTAMDLHEFSKAITAFEKIVTLKAGLNIQGEKEARNEAEEKTGEAGQKIIDEPILAMLCRVVIDHAKENDQVQGFLVNRFLQLLTTITQHVVNNALVYSCFADIYELKSDLEKAIAMREKQCRFLQDSTTRWTESIEKIQDVVRAHEQLIEIYLRSNTKSNLMAGKFSLDTLINKLKKLPVTDSLQGKQCILQLEGLLQRVVQASAAATPTIAPMATGPTTASASATSSLNIWR